jgi:hypothetical protein
MGDDELDVEMLMFDFCRRIDGTKLPAGPKVIEFIFPGLPEVFAVVDSRGLRREARIVPACPWNAGGLADPV